MKFNEGVSQADFDTILRIAKKIGVETGADLQRFKHDEVRDGESVVDAFLRYERELEDDLDLEESLDGESEWIYVASKEVEDSDGFMTEYTWYKKSGEDGDKHIMMFGDSELYEPDEAYADMVFENDTEAEQWFHSYSGFSEDDDLWESLNESAESQGEVTLKVKWQEYERHEAGAINVQTVQGDSLQAALLEVLSMVRTAVDAEEAETQDLSAQAIIEQLRSTNGDGVDFIYYIKDEDTGKVLFQERPLRESVKGKSSAMGRLRALGGRRPTGKAQAINENWCDDALAELEAKPRRAWTEADWDTYHYCKNANAERDWQAAQDDDASED